MVHSGPRLGCLVLSDSKLFLQKVLFVFALTYLLLPLIWFKSKLPGLLYAGGLVALHIVVLAVYAYRVHFRALDPSWTSAGARLLGLALCIGLLLLVSNWADSNVDSVIVFALQLGVLCGVHTLILAFLMVRVTPGRREGEGEGDEGEEPFLDHANTPTPV